MPFSETNHSIGTTDVVLMKRDWDHIYEKWIKRAVESFSEKRIECKRSPAQPGSFVRGIVNDLAESSLVIADLTGGRPNVYYELGVRHALRTGTIIITQHLSALPSDLHGYYAFEYRFTERSTDYEDAYFEFEKNLHDKILSIFSARVTSDSPVSDFLGLRHQLLLKSMEEEKNELVWTLNVCGKVLEENFRTAEWIWRSASSKKPGKIENMLVFDTAALDIAYARLLNRAWRCLPEPLLNNLMEVLNQDRRMFQSLNQYMTVLMINLSGHFSDSFFAFLEHAVERHATFKKKWPKLIESANSICPQIIAEPDVSVQKRKRARRG